jgi:D-glycero-alpha-D-manno-heptose-7-phosphate kinase
LIITRTPLRISLVGGGTDLPLYYENYGGKVLSLSIQKHIYIAINKRFENEQFLLKYSEIEKTNNIQEIKHNLIRSILSTYDLDPIELVSISELPGGTGLGSSSAFAVGLHAACLELQNLRYDQLTLAKKACKTEIIDLADPIGKQDQYGTSIGGIKEIEFMREGDVNVNTLVLSSNVVSVLEKSLILIRVKGTRSAKLILEDQSKKSKNDIKLHNFMHRMKDQVGEAKRLIGSNPDSIGDFLNEGWKLKRELSDKISNKTVDELYDYGIEQGALGGKLLGAGQSGFMLFYVPEKNRTSFIASFSKDLVHDVKIDFEGCKCLT